MNIEEIYGKKAETYPRMVKGIRNEIERKICLNCKRLKCIGECYLIKGISCKNCKHFTSCEKVRSGIKICRSYEYGKG